MRPVPDGCPDVDTPWGEVCRTCGQRLPDPVTGPPVGRTDRGLFLNVSASEARLLGRRLQQAGDALEVVA